MPARRQIVVRYLNSVPLAAKPGIGEINGIGDGLAAWYGRDFDEVNRILNAPPSDDLLDAQALAFKQALSLMIAQRAPSRFLRPGNPELDRLTDSYLRLLAANGIISPSLRDAALKVTLELNRAPAVRATGIVRHEEGRQRAACQAARHARHDERLRPRPARHDGYRHTRQHGPASRERPARERRDARRRAGSRAVRLSHAAPAGRSIEDRLQLHAVRAPRRGEPRAGPDGQRQSAVRHQPGRAAQPRLDGEAACGDHLSPDRHRAARALCVDERGATARCEARQAGRAHALGARLSFAHAGPVAARDARCRNRAQVFRESGRDVLHGRRRADVQQLRSD